MAHATMPNAQTLTQSVMAAFQPPNPFVMEYRDEAATAPHENPTNPPTSRTAVILPVDLGSLLNAIVWLDKYVI